MSAKARPSAFDPRPRPRPVEVPAAERVPFSAPTWGAPTRAPWSAPGAGKPGGYGIPAGVSALFWRPEPDPEADAMRLAESSSEAVVAEPEGPTSTDACDATLVDTAYGVQMLSALETIVPSSGDGGEFYSFVGRARFDYRSESGNHRPIYGCVVFRICLPAASSIEISDDSPLGIVLFVNGTAGVGVRCAFDPDWWNPSSAPFGDDDHPAAVLASGAQMVNPEGSSVTVGEATSLRFVTLHVNNPSYSPAACDSTGDRLTSLANDFLASTDAEGDDNCGAASVAAIEAAVRACLRFVDGYYGAAESQCRLMLSSFSNGAACASAWMRKYATGTAPRHRVHAFVDAEGPTDGFEQLVCSDCVDLLGVSDSVCPVPTGLPTSFDAATWVNCYTNLLTTPAGACRTDPYFDKAYVRYMRPPVELNPELMHEWRTSGSVTTPTDVTPTYAFNPDVLLDNRRFFGRRSLGENVAQSERSGAYIRVQSLTDHVHPDWYKNRHALRALIAAQDARACGVDEPADVFYVDADFMSGDSGAPVSFALGGADPDLWDVATWPLWPELGDYGDRWTAQVLALRWAYAQTFSECP